VIFINPENPQILDILILTLLYSLILTILKSWISWFWHYYIH